MFLILNRLYWPSRIAMADKIKPVFIIGPPRSGTSLVLFMLVRGQKHIAGTHRESQFYHWIKVHPFQKEAYRKQRYFLELLSPEEIDEVFDRSEDPADFFRKAIDKVAENTGKSIFVEKSPNHTFFHKEILRDFPNAAFILLNRHPCAVVHSVVQTKWIPLHVERLPGPLGRSKFLKYMNAMLLYARYHWYIRGIKGSPQCLLDLQYEDVIAGDDGLRQLFEEKLGVEMDELYISRPFSAETEHKEYKLDRSRIEGYKKKMPRWAQRMGNLSFLPQKGFGWVAQKLIWIFYYYPFLYFKLIFGKK